MFNYSTSLADQNNNLVYILKLFIDPQDVIHQLSFVSNGNDYSDLYNRHFAGFRLEQIISNKVEELPNWNWFNLLLTRLKEELNGHFHKTLLEIKKIDDEELVCRCFGVTKNEIDNVKPKSFMQVMAQTKAGAICSNCHPYINYHLASERSRSFYYRNRPQRFWVDQFNFEVDQFTSKFALKENPVRLISFFNGVFEVEKIDQKMAELFLSKCNFKYKIKL